MKNLRTFDQFINESFNVIDYKPKDDMIYLYLITYPGNLTDAYFNRKYKKFQIEVETILSPFGAVIEEDHGFSDMALKILINKKDKTKVKNLLKKISDKYKFESELEIDNM